MKRVAFILLCLLTISCRHAVESPEARVQRLGGGLRCPVCRGVPIASSPSVLAQQMMDVVREQVAAGKSDDEILSYFEDRYGEWALLEPKPQGLNLIIWVLPILFLTGGAAFIIIRNRRQKNHTEAS